MKADKRRVRKTARRLKEARQEAIEDYVKTLAARVNLPASIIKAAVELLEKNRSFCLAKTYGFLRRRLCGWRRLRGLAS